MNHLRIADVARQLSTLVAGLLIATTPALAQSIDIKGVRIGMSQFDIQDLHGQLPLKNFTVAGVASKHGYIDPDFLNGQLERFDFHFDSSEFSAVEAAVRGKIKQIRCSDSIVTSALGKHRTQTICRAKDKKGDLVLIRFDADLLTARLTLRSNAEIERTKKELRKAEKDI